MSGTVVFLANLDHLYLSECIFYFFLPPSRDQNVVFKGTMLTGYLRVLLAGMLSWHTFSADTPSSSGLDRARWRRGPFSNDRYVEVKCSDRQRRPLSSELRTLGEKQRANRNAVHIMTFYAVWKTTLRLITAGIRKYRGFLFLFFCLTAPNNCIQSDFMLCLKGNHCIIFSLLLHFSPQSQRS